MKRIFLTAVFAVVCNFAFAGAAELIVKAPAGAMVSVQGMPDSKCKVFGANRICGGVIKSFGARQSIGGVAHFTLSTDGLKFLCATVNGKGRCAKAASQMNIVIK